MSDINYSLPQFAERKEINYFSLDTPIIIPANGATQQKNGYRFTVNDRSGLYDWATAYFDVTVSLQLVTAITGQASANDNGSCYIDADNANIICGIHSLIRRLTLRGPGGATIYSQDEINKAVFLKKLLEIDPNSPTKQNEYWYLDKSTAINDTNVDPNTGAAGRGAQLRKTLWLGANRAATPPKQNFRIPLRWYSFFASLGWQNLLLTGMELKLDLDIETDDNLIWRDGAAIGKVVVHDLKLALPHIILRPQYYEQYLKFVSSGTPVRWSYVKERIESSQPTKSSNRWKINSVYAPKKVFIYFLSIEKKDSQLKNMYLYDNITNQVGNTRTVGQLRLEFSNGEYFPRNDYLLTTENNQVARIYGDVLEYAYQNVNVSSGSQYTRDQFAVNSMYYFDLEYKKDSLVNDARDMVVNYTLSGGDAQKDFQVYCVILEEHTASYGLVSGAFTIEDEVSMK